MQPADVKGWWKQRVVPYLRRSSQQAKRVSDFVWSYAQHHKKQVGIIAATLLLTASTAAYANHYYTSNIVSIYHVIVNGKELGVVSSPDVVYHWADAQLKEQSKHNGLSLTLSDYITFVEESVYKGKYDDAAALAALAKEAEIKVQAVKIIVNGQVVGYAANEEDAQKALALLKQKYGGVDAPTGKKQAVAASLDSGAKEPAVKQVRFKEDVKTEADSVPAAQVLSVDKLQELLSKGTVKQVIHTVQEGDCISCIAKKYGITSKDIYANNPGVTEDTLLQLGQQLNVTAIKPLVTVQVVEESTEDEVIDYSVQTRANNQLPKGETKVVQEGHEGKKRVHYQIIKENGQVVEKKVLDQQILTEPVPKIVEQGTKVIPSRGTGRLSWPADGYISSGFGMRWGRLHKGIDIAGSGLIRAADNGRVVSAGWDGDYGNCVVIDHGNGIETLYGHMKSIRVKVGDVVPKGKILGVMGETGDATGVHLHFEVHKNGRVMNPLLFLGR